LQSKSHHILLLRIAFVAIWCCTFLTAQAQQENDPEKNRIIELRIEMIAELNEEDEIDYTTLFDELSNYYEHPINLNNAKKEDLAQLKLLTDIQINQLFEHIEKNGKLMSIYELQAVNGFTLQTIRNIMPFIKVTTEIDAPHISFGDMMKNGKHELFIRYSRVLEDQEGFLPIEDSIWAESKNKRYLGSQDKIYTRYRFKFSNKLSWGITAEKDAGEAFLRDSEKENLLGIQQKVGFDYYSAHLFARNLGVVKAVALGDFQTQFGQGLTFWSGLAFGKSADVMNIKRSAIGLRPYTSVDENLFMRGAATTIGIKDFELTAFYSSKLIDANISSVDTLNEEEVSVSSFQASGLHTTVSELEDKDAIRETHMGGHLAYKKRNLNIGLTGVRSAYDATVGRNLQVYNQFEFDTNVNVVVGADYNYIIRNFNFFGEISRSQNGAIAYINGALIALDPKLSFSILQRHYPKDYQQLNSNAVAEGSRNVNEKGVLVGINAKPHKFFTFSGYLDRFHSDWLRFGVDAPSEGHEYLAQLNYKPSKKLQMYVRVRKQEKQENTSEDIPDIDFKVQETQVNYRFNITYKISESFRLRNRVEFIEYAKGNETPEKGFLIYQDIMYQALSKPLSFSFRYALFETDSYDSRLYSYENDVLYFFSIPAYYNRGSRMYLTTRYKFGRHIDVWLRYSQWFYNNRETINSGLNEINGNAKSEIRAQVRFKF
jgi:hypothetical protein